MGVQHLLLGIEAENRLKVSIKTSENGKKDPISTKTSIIINTFIGASNDLATLTITGVKKTQNIS